MRKAVRGFTMVEVIVIITVIGILSTIGVVSFINIQKSARDKQRYNQITIIGEALEKYYDTYGKYPDCSTLAANPTSILTGIDEDVFIPPGSSVPEIKCTNTPSDIGNYFYYIVTDLDDDGNNDKWELRYFEESEDKIKTKLTNRRGYVAAKTYTNTDAKLTTSVVPNNSGTINIYQNTYIKNTKVILVATPKDGYKFTKWGGNCTGDSDTFAIIMDVDKTCTALFGSTAVEPPATPDMTEITATSNETSTTWSWEPVTCQANTTVEYQYKFNTLNGDWKEDYGSPQHDLENNWDIYILSPATNPTSYSRTTDAPGETYTLTIHARCVDNNNSENVSDWSDEESAEYTRPVSEPEPVAPGKPIVTATTDGNYTTWTWDAQTCSSGWTLEYKYHYFTEAYNVGWDEPMYAQNGDQLYETPSQTSYKRYTMYPGYTFNVEVKAICKKEGKPNLEGEPGSALYKRPLTVEPVTMSYSINNKKITWTFNSTTSCPISYQKRYRYIFQPATVATDSSINSMNKYGETTDNNYTTDASTPDIRYILFVYARCYKDNNNIFESTQNYLVYMLPNAPNISISGLRTIPFINTDYYTYSWSHNCGSNANTIRFKYRVYVNGVVSKSQESTASTSVDHPYYIDTVYKVEVQVKCRIGVDGDYTDWSPPAEFIKSSMLMPPTVNFSDGQALNPITNTYNRYINFTNNCGNGATAYYRLDAYSFPMIWQAGNNNTVGWFSANSVGNKWFEDDFNSYQGNTSQSSKSLFFNLYNADGSTPLNMPTGTQYQIRVQVKCQIDSISPPKYKYHNQYGQVVEQQRSNPSFTQPPFSDYETPFTYTSPMYLAP